MVLWLFCLMLRLPLVWNASHCLSSFLCSTGQAVLELSVSLTINPYLPRTLPT